MSRDTKEFINWYMSTLTPEQIAANGGREACIKEIKRQNRNNSGRAFLGNIKWVMSGVWFWIKGGIIILTALYFINAILL